MINSVVDSGQALTDIFQGVSLHSRAARRSAGTPPPKDIAAIPRPASPDDQKKRINSAIERNAYGVSPGSGVSKRKKVLSAKQKRRKEQAMEKAEAALEKLATKVEESVKRGTVVQKRRVSAPCSG